jgi:predicted DNA-binding transcriptional regulator AlpA
MAQRIQRPQRVLGSVGVVEDLTGLSKSTIRRLEASDPDFPKSFKLDEKGDRQFVIAEVFGYLELKAGRPLAA